MSSSFDILKERIMQDGKCYQGGILKVDSFINHQLDPDLMWEIGHEFSKRFAGSGVNKIMTIEASGIAPAIMMGHEMHLPVVFAKKKKPKTMSSMLTTTVHSFTKDRDYTVCISADFLSPDDRIVVIDDFMAYGNASRGLIDLAGQSPHRGLRVYHREGVSARRRPVAPRGLPRGVAGPRALARQLPNHA